ncbi:MAG: T9SS type A sorting domain-containing protein, partial [Bacteroidota bacterium]
LFSLGVKSQQSTMGPKRPSHVSEGITNKFGADGKDISGNIKIINGVPSYIWHRGCGPTALGMVVGYYDGTGYENLIENDALTQTAEVNNAIANDLHYIDYSLPIDTYPELLADKSELGGAHASNCLADFMNTSWSSRGNYYGWSWSNYIAPSFTNYFSTKYSNHNILTIYIYYSNSDNWELYKNEINNNRPVVILVDSDGNGSTDHFVTGIGYDEDNMQYAIYDTWDNNIHWYKWRGMANGNDWGIYGFNIFKIINPPPANQEVSSTTLTTGTTDCFNATSTITVAGDGTQVIVESGASADFIAGQNIRFLPGFHAQAGSYTHGYITETGDYCVEVAPAIVAEETSTKEAVIVDAELTDFAEREMVVYPNPNSGEFTVEFRNFEGETRVMLFNSIGQLVHDELTTDREIRMNVPNAKSGMYFIKAVNGSRQFSQKIVVK